MYMNLDLESLKEKRWLRQMCHLYQTLSTKLPPYLYKAVPALQRSYHNPGCFKSLCQST